MADKNLMETTGGTAKKAAKGKPMKAAPKCKPKGGKPAKAGKAPKGGKGGFPNF